MNESKVFVFFVKFFYLVLVLLLLSNVNIIATDTFYVIHIRKRIQRIIKIHIIDGTW